MQETGSIPGLGRSPGEGTTHSKTPAWRIPWTERNRVGHSPWSQRVGQDLPTIPHITNKITNARCLTCGRHSVNASFLPIVVSSRPNTSSPPTSLHLWWKPQNVETLPPPHQKNKEAQPPRAPCISWRISIIIFFKFQAISLECYREIIWLVATLIICCVNCRSKGNGVCMGIISLSCN